MFQLVVVYDRDEGVQNRCPNVPCVVVDAVYFKYLFHLGAKLHIFSVFRAFV